MAIGIYKIVRFHWINHIDVDSAHQVQTETQMDKITKWISEKTGSTKQTVDHEFELLWQKQETLHETTKATIKHLNQTIENIHGSKRIYIYFNIFSLAFQTNLSFLSEDYLLVYDKTEPQREVCF